MKGKNWRMWITMSTLALFLLPLTSTATTTYVGNVWSAATGAANCGTATTSTTWTTVEIADSVSPSNQVLKNLTFQTSNATSHYRAYLGGTSTPIEVASTSFAANLYGGGWLTLFFEYNQEIVGTTTIVLEKLVTSATDGLRKQTGITGIYLTTSNGCSKNPMVATALFADRVSTGGSSSTSTVFYPLGLNAKINNMSCLATATGTNCTFLYASTTNDITPVNLMMVSGFFFIGFALAYWLIRKMT